MAEEREERAEHGEAQAVEGYGCICGFKTDNGKELRTHLMAMGKQDGKGAHESLGRINLQTGEVIMPPPSAQDSRTKEAEQVCQERHRGRSRGRRNTGRRNSASSKNDRHLGERPGAEVRSSNLHHRLLADNESGTGGGSKVLGMALRYAPRELLGHLPAPAV